MKLENKYIFGASSIIATLIVTTLILPDILYNDLLTRFFSYFLINGLVILIVGVIFYKLLYSSETIVGNKAIYTYSPTLTDFRIEKQVKNPLGEIPEKAFCGVCGKEIYNPFRCGNCGMLLCSDHYLHGSHNCKEV